MAAAEQQTSSQASHEQNWHGIVLQALKRNEIRLVPYVPDRVLTTLIKNLHADPFFTTFPAAREEEAVGIVSGAWMGGMRGAVLMQTSGFATLANVLASLAMPYQIPLILFVSERGTLGDVVAQAKAKPGSLSFAHAGTGTSTHLAGELLKSLARIDIEAIPYKGGAPAINDLLGGQIPMSFNNGPESVGQLQAGTVRALAVTTAARAPFLPDVPSAGEAVPGYDTEVWWGLLGPGNMPPDLVAKLSHDFVAALNTDQVKERLGKLGAQPIGSSPQAFDAKIHADYEKWGPIIQAAGIKAE